MGVRPRHRLLALLLPALAFPGGARALQAQEPPPATVTVEQMTAYARAYIATGELRDSIHAQLAQPRNKTVEAQQHLRERMRERTAQIVQEHGLTDVAWRRITFVISTDTAQRKVFDEIVAGLTAREGRGGGG